MQELLFLFFSLQHSVSSQNIIPMVCLPSLCFSMLGVQEVDDKFEHCFNLFSSKLETTDKLSFSEFVWCIFG